MIDRTGLLGLAALLWLVAVCGCSQGEGEPCQVDDDCESGLLCDARGGARGRCVTEFDDDDGSNGSGGADSGTDEDDAGG